MADANPYAPTKFAGAFAEQLDPSQQKPNVESSPYESQQQFSGAEGKTGKALGIASKFLQGLGQGRMMKALSDEKAKSDKVQRYMAWGESMSNSNLTPEALAKFRADWTHGLITETAGALREGEKNHPIVGAMSKILDGMAGGKIKPSKFDLKAMDAVMAKYAGFENDPKNSLRGRQEGAGSEMTNSVADAVRKLQADKQPLTTDAIASLVPPEVRNKFDAAMGGAGKANDFIKNAIEPYAKPTAPQQQTPEHMRQAAATEALARSKSGKGAGAPGQPPPQVPVPGESLDTPLRQKMGAPPPKTVAGPPPPDQPKVVTPEERDYLSAYKLASKPKEMIVDGKKRQLIYTYGGNGIESGFIDATSGEYVKGNIAEVRPEKNAPNPEYKIATDKNKKYGGGDYFVDVKTGKPLKDENGDVVRPRASATSTFQNRFISEIDGQYKQFQQQNEKLDKEQEQRVAALDRLKVTDPGAPAPRNLNSDEIEKKKKEIYDDVIRRKKANRDGAEMRMRAAGSMFGMPVQPFMTEEQKESLSSGGGGNSGMPEGLGSASDWELPE